MKILVHYVYAFLFCALLLPVLVCAQTDSSAGLLLSDSVADADSLQSFDTLQNYKRKELDRYRFRRVLREDYLASSDSEKVLKKECFETYRKWFYSAFWHQLSAPAMWTTYYRHRHQIHQAIFDYCYQQDSVNYELNLDFSNMDAFCDSYRKIRNGTDCQQYLKLVQYTREALTKRQYRQFCYGETVNIDGVGDTPSWYKPNCKSNYYRRLCFTGCRNAYVQGNMLNRTTGIIVAVKRTVDGLDSSRMYKNRGTGNTAAGAVLEWYTDHNGKMWFYYAHTKPNKNRLFYFGAVGRFGREVGNYMLRFELSNRTCSPVTNGELKKHVND